MMQNDAVLHEVAGAMLEGIPIDRLGVGRVECR